MAIQKPVTETYRAVVPDTGEVHLISWTDDHMPTDREETVICSCGFSEGPARRLRIGVQGHLDAVGAVLQR